jgi:hypothetical protein
MSGKLIDGDINGSYFCRELPKSCCFSSFLNFLPLEKGRKIGVGWGGLGMSWWEAKARWSGGSRVVRM